MKRAAAAFLVALGLVVALGGCRGTGPEMPTGSAGALSGEGFVRASSYEQIYERIASGIPAPARARPNAEADVDGALDAETDVDNAANAEAGAGSSADVPKEVAGLSASPLEVSGGRGYVYRAEGEYLQVLDETTGGRAQEINLYDCVSLGGEAICVAYSEDTLAVLYISGEGTWRYSGDYALAAYAAPRLMVLLFDASEPARIVFEEVIGIVGTPVAVLIDGDALVVATRHKAVPDIDESGQWILDGKDASDVRAYASALSLRSDDAVAWVPSFYDDGELAPLLPEQIYLSGWGSCTTATVIASFALSERACASLFALYDPGLPRTETGTRAGMDSQTGGSGAQVSSGTRVDSGGFVFDYVVDYEGAPAIASVTVPVGSGGALEGIGKVSWAEL
jgi:hypothetical protein